MQLKTTHPLTTGKTIVRLELQVKFAFSPLHFILKGIFVNNKKKKPKNEIEKKERCCTNPHTIFIQCLLRVLRIQKTISLNVGRYSICNVLSSTFNHCIISIQLYRYNNINSQTTVTTSHTYLDSFMMFSLFPKTQDLNHI